MNKIITAFNQLSHLLIVSILLVGYLHGQDNSNTLPIIYTDVSSTNLPLGSLGNNSMDANTADLDSDGDIDIVVACEYCPNIILINDSTGTFSNESNTRLPRVVHDSEDIGIADFDGDGDPDIIFVTEDDMTNEFYLNDGNGFFTDYSGRIPVTGTSNAVLAIDVNNDTIPDIVIGNAGQNVILINDGNAFFTDETSLRLPSNFNTTQDLEWGDIDGDGDNDLLEGNENGNRILINDGAGFFTDETLARLPIPASGEETREVDLGDVDNDGDLDIFYANVDFGQNVSLQNRLLLNDGSGYFTDVTETNLPAGQMHTVDGDFLDIDLDGDLDILTAQAFNGTYQVLLNDSTGVFTDQTTEVYFPQPAGSGIDVEEADFNGDGLTDLYLCGFQHADYLYIAENNVSSVEGFKSGSTPQQFELMQNYPNPFNPSTNIRFSIVDKGYVSLKVFDLLGNEIAVLVEGEYAPGIYDIQYRAEGLASGLYFYRLKTGNFIQTNKMILLN